VRQIIGLAMKVHSTLGPGFLESVYQNALIWEVRKSGLRSEVQKPIRVKYDGQIVGAFAADVLVNDSVIVEVKAVQDWNLRRSSVCKRRIQPVSSRKSFCRFCSFCREDET
jgi:GxxExxY protein